MKDGRRDRGPEGMGWAWGRMGRGRDACEGVGTWADGQTGGRTGGRHAGRAGFSVGGSKEPGMRGSGPGTHGRGPERGRGL